MVGGVRVSRGVGSGMVAGRGAGGAHRTDEGHEAGASARERNVVLSGGIRKPVVRRQLACLSIVH